MKIAPIEKDIKNLCALRKALIPLAKCKSGKQVAALLTKNKIKGSQGDAATCPVVVYLEKITGFGCEVSDTQVSFSDVLREYTIHDVPYEVPVSAAVRDFVTRFDDGKYPELDEDADNAD
jgi:hypothetical protein